VPHDLKKMFLRFARRRPHYRKILFHVNSEIMGGGYLTALNNGFPLKKVRFKL
jgi:hypothetical protein